MKQTAQRFARLDAVDMVRGLAIFFMVIVHTNAYFLSTGSKIVYAIWDIGEFSVPAFIFCAAYIFFRKNYPMDTWKDFFSYLKKRVLRLLIPYYIFAVIFIPFVFFKESASVTPSYFFQTLFIAGGIDINWLVLLFLFFSVIMPFIQFSIKKTRIIFYVFAALTLLSSIEIMLFPFPFDYRYIMWLPWSIIVILSMQIAYNEHKRHYLIGSTLLWFAIFMLTLFIQSHLHHSLTMFNNKYPPNLFHLSYGAFSTTGIYLLAKYRFFSFAPIKKFLYFLSKNSYTLFFIHWGVVYVLWNYTKIQFNWVSFFVVVLIISAVVQIAIDKTGERITKSVLNAFQH